MRLIFPQAVGFRYRNTVKQMLVPLCVFPETVRGLVVTHHEERFILVALIFKPFKRNICDDVSCVTFVFFSAFLMVLPGFAFFLEDRIVVFSLAGKNVVIVKAGRFGVQVPFTYHSRVVAALLKKFGDILLVTVKIVMEGVNAVVVAVFSGEDYRTAWRADRICNEAVVQTSTFFGDAIDIRRRKDIL